MKQPKKRNLQEVVLVARSKFAGVELAYSAALSKIIATAIGVNEKSILCSVEIDETSPVYGLTPELDSIILRYNARILVPNADQKTESGSKIEEIAKQTIEDAFKNENIEFKLEISDNIFKITFFHPSIELPPVVAEKKPRMPEAAEIPEPEISETEPVVPVEEEKKPEEPKEEPKVE